MLLRLTDISRFYGQRLIFKGVSLTLEAGSVMLLTGANGAGKSTLLKIMSGLTAPDSGTVELLLSPGAQIGYMGHQTFIYPQLSALENLRFWSRLHGLHGKQEKSLRQEPAQKSVQKPAQDLDQKLAWALDQVELTRFAQEKAGVFSRGMAQRLNLARILMLEPQLLLLDEPSTGLDTRSRAMLDREILKAKERGAAVVWISHALTEDLPKADLVAELGPVSKKSTGLAYFGPADQFKAYKEVREHA
ncbi:MAG: ABC transporter ATP-binding protein [Deltaproteobacteria bacterium]|jgi:heme exporter protein A|nr:ABC transporter ATP-binding protein [Deltaproteobacteria bacterium]